jgi:hypothetical protein
VAAIEQAGAVRLPVALAEAAAESAQAKADALRAVADALRAARQDVAQDLLREISTLVGELYGSIHPEDADDEVTGAPTIEVQRYALGTAHVRGTFCKKPIKNLMDVYSDGHLDTVGICVFLALRRFRADRDPDDPRLMILDDIVLSVDLSHARRLLDLLRERFADHQVLIFTHNRLFFDWCTKKLPTYRRMEITRWSLENGPQFGDHRSAMERLEEQIRSETSPKILSQGVMNLLDEWLGDALFAYALRVPARRDRRYTLNETWEPLAKRLKEVDKDLMQEGQPLTKLLKRVGDFPLVRNLLAAHDDDTGKEISLREVRRFAEDAVALVRALYCEKCGEFAQALPERGEAEVLRCGCEAIRHVRAGRGGPVG